MPISLTGSRIRTARRRKGLTQTALAARVGISTSYLNLIEHNRRKIGGKILNALAAALDTQPADLSEGGNPSAIADLRAIAAADPGQGVDPGSAEALIGRFPEWAQLLLALNRRLQDQDAVIASLSDRLSHDPFVSENVHAMLSTITAIRSTAGILNSVADIPDAQRSRFHDSMHTESVRLSETAEQLAKYLGTAGSDPRAAATAEEAFDQFLQANRYHFDALDRETVELAGLPREVALSRLMLVMEEILDTAPALGTAPARALAEAYLRRYIDDALDMPLKTFAEAAARNGYDPSALAAAFNTQIPSVFRRLASLSRPQIEVPRFGLVVVTGSGYPLLRQPLQNFALPRHGNACSLWPLYRGFTQPGQPLLDQIDHDNGARFVTLTYAAPRAAPQFGQPADLVSSMLVVAERESPFDITHGASTPVGTSCRICTRTACPARTEPQLLGG